MKLAKGIGAVITLTMMLVPFSFALAGEGIWEGASCAAGSPGPTDPCGFCDALVVVRNIIQLLLEFTFIAAAAMIAVGAFMMMFAAGSEQKFATGKKTITNAAIGVAVALVAWLAVGTILQFLSGKPDLPWNQIVCG